MRLFFRLLFIVTVATVSAQAQTAPAAGELTRLLNDFLAGAGRNDAEVHDRFWADDLIYTRSAGVRVNKEELMRGVRSSPAAKPDDPVTVYSAEDIRIQQYGDAAVVAFRLVGSTTRSDGTKTVSNHLNTGTFIRRKGRWQVVAWQATLVPGPADSKASADAKSTEAKPVVSSDDNPVSVEKNRIYLRGPRGGCHYLNASGRKVYVKQSLCE